MKRMLYAVVVTVLIGLPTLASFATNQTSHFGRIFDSGNLGKDVVEIRFNPNSNSELYEYGTIEVADGKKKLDYYIVNTHKDKTFMVISDYEDKSLREAFVGDSRVAKVIRLVLDHKRLSDARSTEDCPPEIQCPFPRVKPVNAKALDLVAELH